jgi:hypothetical protein
MKAGQPWRKRGPVLEDAAMSEWSGLEAKAAQGPASNQIRLAVLNERIVDARRYLIALHIGFSDHPPSLIARIKTLRWRRSPKNWRSGRCQDGPGNHTLSKAENLPRAA